MRRAAAFFYDPHPIVFPDKASARPKMQTRILFSPGLSLCLFLFRLAQVFCWKKEGKATCYCASEEDACGEECIVPRWLDRFLDLIGVNVLDCRRAGAEQNPTDHIAP